MFGKLMEFAYFLIEVLLETNNYNYLVAFLVENLGIKIFISANRSLY